MPPPPPEDEKALLENLCGDFRRAFPHTITPEERAAILALLDAHEQDQAAIGAGDERICELNTYICTLTAERDALASQVEELKKDVEQWQRAAFFKPRTWETLQDMMKAGDTPEFLAEQYDVPTRFVEFLAFPECDLDARYGRPSDRTKTMKSRAEAAEGRLLALRPYLRHQSCCESWWTMNGIPGRCTCGFEELLARVDRKTDADR